MAKQTNNTPKIEGVKFTTPTFRASFPQLHEAKAWKPKQTPKFQLTALWPKDMDRKEMNKAINKAAAQLWPNKEDRPPGYRGPFRNGDRKADFDGYEGMIYVTMATQTAPGLITRNKKRIPLDEVKDVIYGGCYCRAVVVAKAYHISDDNCGVTLYLQHVQKVEDGEPFGGKGAPESAFDDDLPEGELGDIESDEDDDGAGF